MNSKEIPGFENYIINEEGVVFNKETQQTLKGSTNPAGYHNFRLSKNGKSKTIGRHRLLAMTFKDPKVDIIDLQVNHIDGIKGNDVLDNLEWVTARQNCEHAGQFGLSPKCIPIEVRDVITGEIKTYPSIQSCAIDSGFSKDAINYRVKCGDSRVFPENKQYRYLDTNAKWHCVTGNEIYKNNVTNGILVNYLDKRQVIKYHSQREAATALSISEFTLMDWLKFNDMPTFKPLVQVKLESDNRDWRIVKDPIKDYAETMNGKPILVSNGFDCVIYMSPKECCDALNLKPTTLSERLKLKGKRPFKDGRYYYYYLDYLHSVVNSE